jgi:hypothetical protein
MLVNILVLSPRTSVGLAAAHYRGDLGWPTAPTQGDVLDLLSAEHLGFPVVETSFAMSGEITVMARTSEPNDLVALRALGWTVETRDQDGAAIQESATRISRHACRTHPRTRS